MRSRFFLAMTLVIASATVPSQTAAAAPKESKSDKVIKWRTNLLDAYQEAVQKNKPLVVVYLCRVDRDKCVHCKRYRGSIFSEQVQEYADDAVFVMANIGGKSSSDENAKILASKLGVSETPTLSVLAPDPKAIKELLRLNGYFNATELQRHLDRCLRRGKRKTP